jgi:ribosome maturation factor RimP
MSGTNGRIWELVESYLAAENVELDDLIVGGGLVRVTVDAEGGLDLDRIAEISQGLSRLLDVEDPVAGSYRLEVSSPGLERDLRRPAHYEKSVGREVVVKTGEPVAGERVHKGVLEAYDGKTITVRVGDGERVIPLSAVKQARTVFRWEKAQKGRK